MTLLAFSGLPAFLALSVCVSGLVHAQETGHLVINEAPCFDIQTVAFDSEGAVQVSGLAKALSVARDGTTLTDLSNSANFKAEGFQVSAGVGSASGASAGVGKDSGNASSTTTAAISGVAGNTAARTGDKESGIAKIFDADKVTKDINAQVAITGEFGKQASKAVGDYAGSKLADLKKQANTETDPAKKAALQAEAAKWEEGGASRVALHTAVGGLTGGVQGAVGAGAASAAAPTIDQLQSQLQSKLETAGLSPEAAKALSGVVGGGAAAAVGAVASGGSVAGGASALNADVNNRQLSLPERQKAKELAANSGGDYKQAQIEEQMRLMGNDATGEKPNTTAILVGGEAVRNSVSADPSMPKTIQGEVAVEIPGQANTALQQYIQANTKDIWIPGASPYTSSDPAKNDPFYTNKGPDLTTSQCANGDMACASGVGRQQNAPLSQQAKEAIADSASNISRQAGVIGAGATSATTVVPPAIKPITGSVAIGATAIGVAADAVEQMARPDAGQVANDSLTKILQDRVDKRIPFAAPITNELAEAWKNSGTNNDLKNWSNEIWVKYLREKGLK